MINGQVEDAKRENVIPRCINSKGKSVPIQAVLIDDKPVIVKGKWLKVATIFDEEWMEGEVIGDPKAIVTRLRKGPSHPDIFSFSQKLPDTTPKFDYPFVWDNVAAIAITTYDAWARELSQETRRNIRLAAKRGVMVNSATITDKLVSGIQDIYNETPFRQGRKFWHYGKSFETVKTENSTYLDRCQFISAYAGDELIGFLKMVYIGNVASIMQILCKTSHQNNRPMNALIAKAVELCVEKKLSFLLYRKYIYQNNESNPAHRI